MTILRTRLLLLLLCVATTSMTVVLGDLLEPLFQYDFLRDSCRSGFFPNVATSNNHSLHFESNVTSCSPGNVGVETHSFEHSLPNKNDHNATQSTQFSTPKDILVESSADIVSALQQQGDQHSGVTISFWMKPLAKEFYQTAPILTIGRTSAAEQDYETDSSSPSFGLTECDGIDLQISLTAEGFLEVLYRTSDPYFEPCQTIKLSNLPSFYDEDAYTSSLHHVAIVLSDRYQQVFVDGQRAAPAAMRSPFDVSHWDPFHVMSFFYHNQDGLTSTWAWYGRLYGVSLFSTDAPWNAEQVQAVMAPGLPPAAPIATAQTVLFLEDKVRASAFPRTIVSGNTNETEVLPGIPLLLETHLLDWQVQELLQNSAAVLDDIDASNTSAWSPPVYFYVTRIPRRGRLYPRDGTHMALVNENDQEDGSLFIPLTSGDLLFQADNDKFSDFDGVEYTSLEFCVSLRSDLFAHPQCDSHARVSIMVDPVNDPPIAIVDHNDLPFQVHEGVVEESWGLQLTGRDMDEGDSITAIQITTPPQFGDLYLSVAAFRDDGLVHGQLLSDLNYSIPGSEAYVEYRYQGSNRVVQGRAVQDMFHFRVRDSFGEWSESVSATIQVLAAVVTTPPDRVWTTPSEIVTFNLDAVDSSGLNRSVEYVLETAIPQRDGNLVDPRHPDDVVQPGSRLHTSSANDTQLSFVPTHDSFCEQQESMNSSFSYRAITLHENGDVASISPIAHFPLGVQCVRQPSVLTINHGVHQIEAFVEPMDSNCSGYHHALLPGNTSFEELGCSNSVVIGDIHVSPGSAQSYERALVVLKTEASGRLTLNRERSAAARKLQDHSEMRPEIIFLANSVDLNDILSGLHFQSAVHTGEHNISITLIQGDYVEMMQRTHFQGLNDTELDNCFASTQTIHVEVTPATRVRPKVIFSGVNCVPVPAFVILILLITAKGKLRETFAQPIGDDQTVVVQEFYDDHQGTYFYTNSKTKETKWHPPTDEAFVLFNEDGSVSTSEHSRT